MIANLRLILEVAVQAGDHCENNFDEIKNLWGWSGFVTQKIKPCRFIARMIALIYNWWLLFVRLVEFDKHFEAIVSRPLLLQGVGFSKVETVPLFLEYWDATSRSEKWLAQDQRINDEYVEV